MTPTSAEVARDAEMSPHWPTCLPEIQLPESRPMAAKWSRLIAGDLAQETIP